MNSNECLRVFGHEWVLEFVIHPSALEIPWSVDSEFSFLNIGYNEQEIVGKGMRIRYFRCKHCEAEEIIACNGSLIATIPEQIAISRIKAFLEKPLEELLTNSNSDVREAALELQSRRTNEHRRNDN